MDFPKTGSYGVDERACEVGRLVNSQDAPNILLTSRKASEAC